VVPAEKDKWIQPDAFEPVEDAEGKIFARGTQDMVGVWTCYDSQRQVHSKKKMNQAPQNSNQTCVSSGSGSRASLMNVNSLF
jgi:hypothetical protein